MLRLCYKRTCYIAHMMMMMMTLFINLLLLLLNDLPARYWPFSRV